VYELLEEIASTCRIEAASFVAGVRGGPNRRVEPGA
jgi:hypothetical protein